MGANLNLDPEELHYLCQETNRPTLGVTWNYLELVYLNSFIREQPKQYVSYFVYLSGNLLEEKPELREYASYVELRETVKKQRIFDIARWEYTRHLLPVIKSLAACAIQYRGPCNISVGAVGRVQFVDELLHLFSGECR